MNGTECGECGQIQCQCNFREQLGTGMEAMAAIESLWHALAVLPRWKMRIVRWFWPEIMEVTNKLRQFYWKEQKK